MGWPTLLRNWILGSLVGVFLLAVTSPLFLRSYHTRQLDRVRGVLVFDSGTRYRWRSDGYATTTIGPLGMPGQRNVRAKNDQSSRQDSLASKTPSATMQVVLWGDSQLEGVCVDDQDKIANQVNVRSRQRINALPFARSGDNCNDWFFQIRHMGSVDVASVPDVPAIDAHVFLVTELSDWAVPIQRDLEFALRPGERFFGRVPAVVLQAGRNLLEDPVTGQRRSLRFMPCWDSTTDRSHSVPVPLVDPDAVFRERTELLSEQLVELNAIANQPCCFVYAPKVPAVIDGQLKFADEWAAEFEAFRSICRDHGWTVVDLREAMQRSVEQGVWPRGFDNGQFGVGHYNRVGNQIIARAIVEQLETLFFRESSDAPPED